MAQVLAQHSGIHDIQRKKSYGSLLLAPVTAEIDIL